MIRTTIFYIALFPMTIFFSLTAIICYKLTGKNGGAVWSARTWSKVMLFCGGIRLKKDYSALPKEDAPFILMANHQSLLDIFALYASLPIFRSAFIAKQSLFKIPIFGWSLKGGGLIPIDRSNSRRAMKSIADAVDRTRQGWSIIIFPEGTRDHDFDKLAPFQIGGMVLTLKSGLPIAPIVMTGSGEILPKGQKGLTRGKRTIRIKALPPVITEGKYTLKERERLKDDLYELMNRAYLEMRRNDAGREGDAA